MIPILIQLDPESEKRTSLSRTILAKNLCLLSINETDINKKIEYNERALRHYSYIPSYIWLGKWYSLRGCLKLLNNNVEYQKDKNQAEQKFEQCFNEININNNRVSERMTGKIIINHHLFHEWGSHFYRWGDYDHAREKFDQEIKTIQKYTKYESKYDNLKNIFRARISIINCLCKSGTEPGELYRQLQKLLDENPYHPFIYVTLGILNCKEQKYRDALDNFDKSIEIKPDNYYPYWHKARVLLRNNNQVKAQSCFKKACDLIKITDNEINKIKLKRWGEKNNLLARIT